MYFSIDKKSKIILYGASDYSCALNRNLCNNGYQTIAYLDRRAKEIGQIDSLPIYTLETLPYSSQDRNLVFILCFQNALQHEKVAKLLNKKGFNNILYLPMKSDGGTPANYRSMRTLYGDFLDGQIKNLKNIPCYSKMFEETRDLYSAIIKRNEKVVVFWAPVELCYSPEEQSRNRVSDYTEQAKQLLKNYQGINLCAQEPHVKLMRYFSGQEQDCSLYLKIYGQEGHINKSFIKDEEFIKDRFELYKLYKSSLNEGMDFFIDSPMECIVDAQRRIIVLDGNHRGVFLIEQGFKWIPAKVSNEDYEYLCNRDQADVLVKYMKHSGVKGTKMPIPHPLFYRFPSKEESTGPTILSVIQRRLGKLINISAIDISKTQGYYARNLYRMGATKVDCVIEHYDTLTNQLNRLFDIQGIELISDVEMVLEQKYDIVIMDVGKLQGNVSLKEIRRIIKLAKHYVILQYKDEQDVEGLLAGKRCLKLATSIIEGKREIVVMIDMNI